MNTWYAQKLLADDHAAERRAEANRHHRVRAEARRAVRAANRSAKQAASSTSPSRWRAALAVLARRQPAPSQAPSSLSAPVRSGHATAAS